MTFEKFLSSLKTYFKANTIFSKNKKIKQRELNKTRHLQIISFNAIFLSRFSECLRQRLWQQPCHLPIKSAAPVVWAHELSNKQCRVVPICSTNIIIPVWMLWLLGGLLCRLVHQCSHQQLWDHCFKWIWHEYCCLFSRETCYRDKYNKRFCSKLMALVWNVFHPSNLHLSYQILFI